MHVIAAFMETWTEKKLAALGIDDSGDSSKVGYFCEHMMSSWLPDELSPNRSEHYKGPELVCPFHKFSLEDVEASRNALLDAVEGNGERLQQHLMEAITDMEKEGVVAWRMLLTQPYLGWLNTYLRLHNIEHVRLFGVEVRYQVGKDSYLLSTPAFGRYALLFEDIEVNDGS